MDDKIQNAMCKCAREIREVLHCGRCVRWEQCRLNPAKNMPSNARLLLWLDVEVLPKLEKTMRVILPGCHIESHAPTDVASRHGAIATLRVYKYARSKSAYARLNLKGGETFDEIRYGLFAAVRKAIAHEAAYNLARYLNEKEAKNGKQEQVK